MQKKYLALALLISLLLMGCAGEPNVSTMTIDKDGTVESYIVEDFTVSYYDAEELKNSVSEDILYYNEKYEQTVIELTKYELAEGVLKTAIKYQNTNLYEEFNEETLFVGLLDEALAEGYNMDAHFYSVKDMANKLTIAEIENDNYHIMIFSEPVDVKVPKKILYVSDGLQKGNSSKKATVTDKTKEIYYIIYE